MLLKKSLAFAAAGLTAGCAAFMIPPEVSEGDVAIAEALAFKAPETAEAQTISLDCPGCPMQVRNRKGHVKVKQGKQNHLELTFAIDHLSDHDILVVNGFPLYPKTDPIRYALTAPQVLDHQEHHKEHKAKGASGKKEQLTNDEKVGEDEATRELMAKRVMGHHKMPHQMHRKEILPPQLGFGLQVAQEVKDADQHYDLISMDLQIIEVGNVFVDGIPNVHIKLIKDAANNKLMIGSVETTTSTTIQSSPMDKQASECTTLMCKWMALMRQQMARVRQGCFGRKGGRKGMMGMMGMMGGAGRRPGHMTQSHQDDRRPEHAHGHGGHSHSRYHSWGQLARNVTSHILLPILIGILAGVTVSLFGMLIGTIIITLWRTFARRPCQRRAAVKACQNEAVLVDEEKAGLMEHQELPPSYEDGAGPSPKVDV